jgi:hypothetical protein
MMQDRNVLSRILYWYSLKLIEPFRAILFLEIKMKNKYVMKQYNVTRDKGQGRHTPSCKLERVGLLEA